MINKTPVPVYHKYASQPAKQVHRQNQEPPMGNNVTLRTPEDIKLQALFRKLEKERCERTCDKILNRVGSEVLSALMGIYPSVTIYSVQTVVVLIEAKERLMTMVREGKLTIPDRPVVYLAAVFRGIVDDIFRESMRPSMAQRSELSVEILSVDAFDIPTHQMRKLEKEEVLDLILPQIKPVYATIILLERNTPGLKNSEYAEMLGITESSFRTQKSKAHRAAKLLAFDPKYRWRWQ